MKTLNIGVLAHVDAGKTSLTERLLFDAGVIDRLGSVDSGDTQTDTLDLERRRGITIKTAVAAFLTGDVKITLIDTPGHADFIAEVERALRVLDGAVLVVSAVEGVEAQTRVLMRTLTRLGIPTLLFVNKIDRPGAADAPLLDAIRARLSPRSIALSTVTGLGTPSATALPRDFDSSFLAELGELLADGDDAFFESYVDDSLSEVDYRRELARQAGRGALHPVFFGSAITGTGVADLVQGIRSLLPATVRTGSGRLRATVFKIERGREKIVYARLHTGTLTPRTQVPLFRRDRGGVTELSGRVSAVDVFDGPGVTTDVALAGDVVRLRGLRDVRIGDQLGTSEGLPTRGVFAPPSLETLVRPRNPDQSSALYPALERLSEQDPFIDVRRHDSGDVSVRLFGEVQKEVVATMLAEEYGLDVVFEQTRPLYVEMVTGSGEAVEELDPARRTYFFATVGLRIDPTPRGSGVSFALSVELGSLPLAFHKAIEETVHSTLQQGLHGWEVLDCAVTLTRTGYFSPISAAGDFRKMTPLVLMSALHRAGTRIHEPFDHFELEVPASGLSAAMLKLTELRAIPGEPALSPAGYTLDGLMPAASVAEFERALPAFSQGEGVFFTEFAEYRPRSGPPPIRPRTGPDPLNRNEYLRHTVGRA